MSIKPFDCIKNENYWRGGLATPAPPHSPLPRLLWQYKWCSLNYKGSSPAMEKVGAEKIFKQSLTKHSLYYTSFYGDGDSKGFPALENAFGLEKPIKKYECIGHYQKRVSGHVFERKMKT